MKLDIDLARALSEIKTTLGTDGCEGLASELEAALGKYELAVYDYNDCGLLPHPYGIEFETLASSICFDASLASDREDGYKAAIEHVKKNTAFFLNGIKAAM